MEKLINANAYLHFYAFSYINLKISVAQNLFLRALRICDDEFLDDEFFHIRSSLSNLAYPKHILDKALRNAKWSFSNSEPKTYEYDRKNSVCVPFVPSLKCKSNFSKNVMFKYNNKLCNSFSNVKKVSNFTGGVYKIPCHDCNKFYIGETGRNFNVRLKEHKRDIVNGKLASGVADHSRKHGHSFDFINSHLIFNCNDLLKRRIVESAIIKHNYKNVTNLNEGFISVSNNVWSFVNSCLTKKVLDVSSV